MTLRGRLVSSATAIAVLTGIAADRPWETPAPVTVTPAAAPRTTAKHGEVALEPPQPPNATCDLLSSLRPRGSLPAPGRMPAGSPMARITERGRLIVAVGPDTYLNVFRNPETGQLEGFDIDLAADISEAIFGDRRPVEYQQLDVHGRLDAVESGKVDLSIANTTITCARREKVEFSTEYYRAGQR
ncbi:MAG TPA: transporter substrate-binding domain-containing protein, partial [Pseudonocardiaceae bacterium]|nr:transporter substrate-binding domain-containing protein [Pseudonocardiaceae bacterium]